MEIYLAEIDLIAQGYGTAELSRISELYDHLIASNHLEIKKELDKGHPILKLMIEHDNLFNFILALERFSDDIGDELGDEQKEFLKIVVKNLFELDKHFQREEKTIFNRLRTQRLEGRTILLSEEHDDIWEDRECLKKLMGEGGNGDEIMEKIDNIIYILRFHAFMENDLLYPVALEKIEDWERVSAESDKIGYCEFIPVPKY